MEGEENHEVNETENTEQPEVEEQSVSVEQAMPKKRVNVISWAALVLSVVGAILGIITAAGGVSSTGGGDWLYYIFIACSVAGMGLGIAGTARSKKLRSGKGIGITAIVIGALSLLAVLGIFLLIIYIFSNLRFN